MAWPRGTAFRGKQGELLRPRSPLHSGNHESHHMADTGHLSLSATPRTPSTHVTSHNTENHPITSLPQDATEHHKRKQILAE